ncbi:PAS domain [Moorella glycerini]|uniref:PAS fold-4 domain-containing protein n=1 Tax=Neomoorella stamsii TaxID=1266720 RepID=A0A9X7J4P1_9FIRM|nr:MULTISPECIES: hypothetical protein [Moorella]PRR74790.1 hypothetical protein MOST_09650 [Moorella stamsii]CEP65972.1 PAS domain [Moorella glycerini]
MVNLIEELLLQLLGEIPIGVTWMDANGRLFYTDPLAEKLLGPAPGATATFLDCHPPHLHGRIQACWQEITGQSPSIWQHTIYHGNRWVQNYFIPLSQNCYFKGLVIISREITGKHRRPYFVQPGKLFL